MNELVKTVMRIVLGLLVKDLSEGQAWLTQ